jgi:HD-GYP domain-containing protein (c-di-GMP phosphodiesterase class II)
MTTADATELGVVELFSTLTPESLEELAAGAEVRNYAAGQFIFKEGDPGESLHVVRSGLIRIVRSHDPETTLQTLGPGKTFGELAVFDPAPRSATALAVDASETLELHRAELERILDRDPQATRRILGTMARSLTMARERVVHHNQILDQKVAERTKELRETQLEVIRRLGQAAEFRDDDTGLHITRMSRFCAKLAATAGFTQADCELLLEAAPMHDIGKIGIPDRILLKPGKLEDEEFDIMKTHTTIGSELLSGSSSPVMQLAQIIALNHHEKWNGRGYPRGLKGEDIPLVARICSICDVFDALCSERPYKKPWDPGDALRLIEEQAGNDFDPHLAKLFLEISEEIVRMFRDPTILMAAAEGSSQEAREMSPYSDASQPSESK